MGLLVNKKLKNNLTLQQVYDNSSEPEILTDSTRGAVTVKRGSAADTDNIYEGKDGSDNVTFAVTGQGKALFKLNVVTITTSDTIDATHLNRFVLLSSASDITITLPQQSTLTTLAGEWFRFLNIGVGNVTFVKEGAESLSGNTIAITNAGGIVTRQTTTSWDIQGGTAIINRPALSDSRLDITTSQTKTLAFPLANATLLGIKFDCFSLSVAGTFKLQYVRDAVATDITGLTSLVPATSETVAYATTALNLLPSDKLQIVADGTLAIADLLISYIYTETL